MRQPRRSYPTPLLDASLAHVESIFLPYPHLWPLRDRFIALVKSGRLKVDSIHPQRAILWNAIRWLGDNWEHAEAVSQGVLPAVRKRLWDFLRSEAEACGLSSPLLELPQCRHASVEATVHAGAVPVGRCGECTGRPRLRRLFKDRPDLAMLEKYLERQIDAGVFNQTMFKPNARFGKLFHALVSHKGLPDHAWIDAQPLTAATSEIFRRELIASGILAPLVRRNDDKNRDLRLFVRRTSCEHSKTPCKLCMARRHIEAGFREFPTLWPLRDRFIEQLHCRFYQPEFFCAWQNPLWPLIRVLGEAPLVTHALIDAQPRQYRHQRLIRSELVASGLLPPILEHPGIGRFTAIADEMLSQVGWRNEGDRRLVERYIRMHLLSRLRKSLRGKDDRDIAPVGLVRTELRQVLRFVSVVETEGRTLCNFTKADVRAAWGTRSDGLRLLLQWLAEEGVSEERFIPRRLKRDDGYAGVGTPALRANVNRLLALDAEPSVRLAGILTYCGVFATELALLRASDVLPDGDITIGGKVCHLHGTIAKLTIALRQNLLEEVCGRRPVGWDPWLFAPADAIEGPSGPEILDKLRNIGIDVRSMRSDGQRISLQQPLSAYALDQNLKRSSGMTMERVKVFASEPGAYAILLASEKLKPS